MAVERKLEAQDARVLDARGLVVAPGLVDMHVHFREPGYEYKEDIATGSRAAARGGFTSVACMPNTDPVLDAEGLVAQVLRRGNEVGLCRVYPIAAITKGQKGVELTEMRVLAETGAVGFSDDGAPVDSARVMRRALEYATVAGRPIIAHCEERALSAGGHMHEGEVSARLGIPGMPGAAEDVGVARDVRLAEVTSSRLHVCHVSTARSVEVVRTAKERGVRVTAEATPHHFTLTDEAVEGFDANTKMNPPLAGTDRQAVIEGCWTARSTRSPRTTRRTRRARSWSSSITRRSGSSVWRRRWRSRSKPSPAAKGWTSWVSSIVCPPRPRASSASKQGRCDPAPPRTSWSSIPSRDGSSRKRMSLPARATRRSSAAS